MNGARLGELIDPQNTARDPWSDTSYRLAKNEDLLRAASHGVAPSPQEAHGRPLASRNPANQRPQVSGAFLS